MHRLMPGGTEIIYNYIIYYINLVSILANVSGKRFHLLTILVINLVIIVLTDLIIVVMFDLVIVPVIDLVIILEINLVIVLMIALA